MRPSSQQGVDADTMARSCKREASIASGWRAHSSRMALRPTVMTSPEQRSVTKCAAKVLTHGSSTCAQRDRRDKCDGKHFTVWAGHGKHFTNTTKAHVARCKIEGTTYLWGHQVMGCLGQIHQNSRHVLLVRLHVSGG